MCKVSSKSGKTRNFFLNKIFSIFYVKKIASKIENINWRIFLTWIFPHFLWIEVLYNIIINIQKVYYLLNIKN